MPRRKNRKKKKPPMRDVPGRETKLRRVAEHLVSIPGVLSEDENAWDFEFFLEQDRQVLSAIAHAYGGVLSATFAIALNEKLGFPIVDMGGGRHFALRAPDGSVIDYKGRRALSAAMRDGRISRRTPIIETTVEALMALVPEDQRDDEDREDEEVFDAVADARLVVDILNRW